MSEQARQSIGAGGNLPPPHTFDIPNSHKHVMNIVMLRYSKTKNANMSQLLRNDYDNRIGSVDIFYYYFLGDIE